MSEREREREKVTETVRQTKRERETEKETAGGFNLQCRTLSVILPVRKKLVTTPLISVPSLSLFFTAAGEH